MTVTATVESESIKEQVRSVTDEDIVSLRARNGWVKLPGFISRDLAGRLQQGIEAVISVRQGRVTHDHLEVPMSRPSRTASRA